MQTECTVVAAREFDRQTRPSGRALPLWQMLAPFLLVDRDLYIRTRGGMRCRAAVAGSCCRGPPVGLSRNGSDGEIVADLDAAGYKSKQWKQLENRSPVTWQQMPAHFAGSCERATRLMMNPRSWFLRSSPLPRCEAKSVWLRSGVAGGMSSHREIYHLGLNSKKAIN